MKGLSIFLITVLLISSAAGCTASDSDPNTRLQYDLTIYSTEGGKVINPGEGTSAYDAGAMVELVPVADESYEFVKWTGDVGTIANVNSASTTITMHDNYSITANFEPISPVRYNLTLSSTVKGSITTPGEGTFAYDAGTVVDLIVTPVGVYRFANWTGNVATIADVNAASTTITMNGDYSITANLESKYLPMVSAGIWHTLGLKSDGIVVSVGYNPDGQCDVGDWTHIVQVAAGEGHTVGLKSDGTVVAVGRNDRGQCNVGDWKDIVQVDAGRFHTVGLTSDGTLIAVGSNDYGECDVGDWSDIIQVVTGFYHTVGLKSNGTVVAVGFTGQGRLEVGDWADITQVGAGGHQTIGLKSDGTVVAVGRNNYGECNVGGWTDIVQVTGGCQVTVGLKADDTVVAVGWNEYGQCNVGGWTDIVQVTAGMGHTVGLKSDGSVVAVGSNGAGRCNVGHWMLSC
jgi:hypothetical protein